MHQDSSEITDVCTCTDVCVQTLKASDRFVGFRQQANASSATVRVTVRCEGNTLLIGADLEGTASLRAGASGLAGLELSDAIVIKAADAREPDVTAQFAGGKGFAAHVGKDVSLEIEMGGGARVFSVAWL
eukprot:SAG22_NODE_1449_length_4399_cov_6.411860_3_plen_130_part_00